MRVCTYTQRALSVDWDEFCVRIGSHAESIKQKSSLRALFMHLKYTHTHLQMNMWSVVLSVVNLVLGYGRMCGGSGA